MRHPMACESSRRDDRPHLLLTAPCESPSLSASAGPEVPAFELKFLLSEAQAKEIAQRVAGRLTPDPYADPNRGFAYHTTSLYCDTPQFDVFHRVGSYQRRKHRLRRYERSPHIFLERKSKWGQRVKKRRTMIPESELALLAHPMSVLEWPGHWFHRHLVRRGLAPVCRIAYERVALVGQSEEGPVRLTFDRQLRGADASDWDVSDIHYGLPLLTGRVICEFKYRAFVPALFKEIMHALQLTPGPVSKYRTFLRVSGRVADRGAADA